MLKHTLGAALLGLMIAAAPAKAVTVDFGNDSDDLNVVAFDIGGLLFEASGNDGRLVNQSAAGLGLTGALPDDPNIEGRRIAGPEVLTITFLQPVFIAEITFAEFNEGIEPVGITANGIQVSDNLLNGIGIELAEQAGTTFGQAGDDSFQTFSANAIGIEGVVVNQLAFSGIVAGAGNRGFVLAGFTAQVVPLPAPILMALSALAAFGFIGWRRRQTVS